MDTHIDGTTVVLFECDESVVSLDGEEVATKVVLHNKAVVGAAMDDEQFPSQVIAALLVQDTFIPQTSVMFLLLLQPLDTDNTRFRRVGLARQAFKPLS